jgi:hypothetical protein
MWGNQRNDFSILGTTNVLYLDEPPAKGQLPATPEEEEEEEEEEAVPRGSPFAFGAVLLRFDNTTATHDPGWSGMASGHSCSLLCLSRHPQTLVVRATTLLVACPAKEDLQSGMWWRAPSKFNLAACRHGSGDILLIPDQSSHHALPCEWRALHVEEAAGPGLASKLLLRASFYLGKYSVLAMGGRSLLGTREGGARER